MTNQPIKISENCWKHTDEFGNTSYRKTFDPESELHRKDGPAIEFTNGYKAWYINGKRNREDGPAVEYASGYKAWFINGMRHRTNGPAIEEDVNDIRNWYYKGKYIDVHSQEEFELYLKNLIFF